MTTAAATAWPTCADCAIPALTSVRMSAEWLSGPCRPVDMCPPCALKRTAAHEPLAVGEALGDLAAEAQLRMPGSKVVVTAALLLQAELATPVGPRVQRIAVLPGSTVEALHYWWHYPAPTFHSAPPVLVEAEPVHAAEIMAQRLERKLMLGLE